MTKNVMRVIWVDDEKNVTLRCEKCAWTKNFRFHFKNKNIRILDVGEGWECRNLKNIEQCEIAENEKRENYCDNQVECDCINCSLSFEGRDCMNKLIEGT